MSEGFDAPLNGCVRLARAVAEGRDLRPLAQRLLAQARSGDHSAESFLDLSWLLQLQGDADGAATALYSALALQQHYRLPAPSHGTARRLLVLHPSGEYLANTPVEFLLEDSDVAIELLFIGDNLPWPDELPAHDVLFVAICESDEHRTLLHRVDELLAHHPQRVINAPARIPALARDSASRLLANAPGILAPPNLRVDRATVERIAFGDAPPEGSTFPLLLRPVGSHRGRDLVRFDHAGGIAPWLLTQDGEEFFLCPFIDYRSRDGNYWKYRVALIDGVPFASHLAISSHWMVNFINAQMGESPEKRAAEQQWMERFDRDFAHRHADAFRTIHERFALDYLVMDCAESADGRLLVFEIDSAALVHALDPVDLYPYKQPAMRKLFAAFRALLNPR
jgi:hypothetical protein